MTRTCAWCGTSFSAPTARATYCSGAHRAAASKARATGTSSPAGEVVVGPITTRIGSVRTDLERWLDLREVSSHPLAAAALALADRLDEGNDTSSAMASGVGRLQAVLVELQGTQDRDVDVLDLLRLKVVAKMAGEDAVVEALSIEAIQRLQDYQADVRNGAR